MSCVWVICGAGRGVGKTTLALKLCELLPGSVYAKCGHCAPKAGKPENFFHVSSPDADVIIFIEGIPKRTHVRKDANSLRSASQLHVSADSPQSEWRITLNDLLPDERLLDAVCGVLADQQGYLAGRRPAVRTKVWLESAGERVFGYGLAKLLESVELKGTLGGAAREAGLSYRYAWNLIRSGEKRTGRKLVIRQPGGLKGGSSTLSELGRQMLSLFQTLNHDVAAYADRRLAELYKENFNAGHE